MKKRKINFIERRFPEDISYGSSGGPCYSTDIIMMVSGHEQRNINWQHARSKYNIARGIKSESQMQELIAFFRACKGKAIGFRFKDWSDYKAENQLIATSDGKEKTFQLRKHYLNGEVIETRIITKPVIGSVEVFLDNKKAKEVEVDHTTGRINFVKLPAVGVKIWANFEFDVPVRFDTDVLLTSIEAYQVHALQNIPLVEIKI